MTDTNDVVHPEQFNERFTLYLNTEGKSVQRTLREMTADEVLLAINWQTDEVERLGRASEHAKRLAEANTSGFGTGGITQDEAMEAVATLRAGSAAQERAARLMALVSGSMPQWHGQPEMKLRDALHRFWPGGRAA